MRMLIMAITLLANVVMGAYDFELCKNAEDCPTDIRPLTDTCALLVAPEKDDKNKKEGMVCVDDIYCDRTYEFFEGGEERTFDVYCGAKAFWYNNRTWFIIVIILIVILLLGAIYCCCCKKDKNSAF